MPIPQIRELGEPTELYRYGPAPKMDRACLVSDRQPNLGRPGRRSAPVILADRCEFDRFSIYGFVGTAVAPPSDSLTPFVGGPELRRKVCRRGASPSCFLSRKGDGHAYSVPHLPSSVGHRLLEVQTGAVGACSFPLQTLAAVPRGHRPTQHIDLNFGPASAGLFFYGIITIHMCISRTIVPLRSRES